MRKLALLALLACAVLPARADPREDLAGDWWGMIAERRLSLSADGTLTEFRPTDTEERKGTWEIDGNKISIQFEGEKSKDTFTFAIKKDDLTLTQEDGRTTRLVREARADRENRLGDRIVEMFRKGEEAAEEPDQFKRELLQKDAMRLFEDAEPLARSLFGDNREKQQEGCERLARTRDAELVSRIKGAKPDRAKTNCKNALKKISIYLALFEGKFKRYPKTIDELKRPNFIEEESLLNCPAAKEGEKHPFIYVPPNGDDAPANTIVAYDPVAHDDGLRNVLTFQGRVVTLNEENFKAALASKGSVVSDVGPRARDVKARLAVRNGKVVVTINAKIDGLRAGSVDGKERVHARVTIRARVQEEKQNIESGVRVISGEPDTAGHAIQLTVTLPTSDPDRLASLVLWIDDRVTHEVEETQIELEAVERK
ncbi:MAG: DUF5640 domain-containing protein [Planctomycetota bacterium]